MNVRMVIEFLTPGVKDLYDPGSSAKELRISGKLKKSLRRDFVKEGVKSLLIQKEELIKIVRHSEDDMKVIGVDDFRSSFIDPYLFEDSLTVRTVTVSA